MCTLVGIAHKLLFMLCANNLPCPTAPCFVPHACATFIVYYSAPRRACLVQTKFPLADDNQTQLKTDIGHRLIRLIDKIHQGQALPAWENKDICQYCSLMNLCRCGTWQGKSQ